MAPQSARRAELTMRRLCIKMLWEQGAPSGVSITFKCFGIVQKNNGKIVAIVIMLSHSCGRLDGLGRVFIIPNATALPEEKQENTAENKAVLPVPAMRREKPISVAWNDLTQSATGLFASARYHTVKALPAWVVNHSSNLLGFAHVWTEVIMLKASAPGGVLVKNAKWYEWPHKALYKVYDDAFKGALKSSSASIKIFDGGNPLKNMWRIVADTEEATKHQIKLQGLESHPERVKLSNPWQMRSTLSGLVVWALSAVIPDKKESDEEVERMTIMQKTNPGQYVAERFKQAVWAPGWGDHKRQMIGLGIMISGVCSTLGAWRNRTKPTPLEVEKLGSYPKFIFNLPYLCTSALTFAASLPLLFATDNQRGFSGFGTWMTGRLLFLPSSISNKFAKKEDGAAWYLTGMAGFQIENWAQALVGGAEKKPDGTIVDHTAIREIAAAKAQKIREKQTGRKEDIALPSTVVGKVVERELAMPELLAEKQAQQDGHLAAAMV